MSKSEFDLDTFLPYRLSLLANTVSKALEPAYATYALTRTQWRVMAVLSSGEATAQYICQKTLMDKTTISRAVKNLVERGIVKRQPAYSDGRMSPLAFTAKGRQVFEQIVPTARTFETTLKQKLTQDQLKTLETIITHLLKP